MKTAGRILLTCMAMVAVAASSARAADLPTANPAPAAPPTLAACASVQDIFVTDCPLTWHGISLYGAHDGAGWVSHGAF
jgi:hypothetical protein